ncbi:MAG: DNA internalization-related competence protein ComEC/Rec2 [Planctomyces sp.]|jgi:competence protein ComEC
MQTSVGIQGRTARTPPAFFAAILLIVGVVAGEQVSPAPGSLLILLAIVLLLNRLAERKPWRHVASGSLSCGILILGMLLWVIRSPEHDPRSVRVHDVPEGEVVRVSGTVTGIPSLQSVGTHSTQETPKNLRTSMMLRGEVIRIDDRNVPMTGTWRVFVDGEEAADLTWGDKVEVLGRCYRELGPKNPGEFDYRQFLDRQRCEGLIFVKHPNAVAVQSRTPVWDLRFWVTTIRRTAEDLMHRHLPQDERSLADAILLGNRGHMDPATERHFVASGTMHLLAISGLHVGILYLFVTRIFTMLLIRRKTAILAALGLCVIYAAMTDLRPSVLRSVGFIGLGVIAECLNRPVGMLTMISSTAFLYVLCDPSVVFDTGAWLSFVAVGALAWADSGRGGAQLRSGLPPVFLSRKEWLIHHAAEFGGRLRSDWNRMIAVTVFSMPLTVFHFHILSVSGLVVNLLLIPWSAVVMISGFVFIVIGAMLPLFADLAAFPFGASLRLLQYAVDQSAAVTGGDILVPDLPSWFLPLYYVLLSLLIVSGIRTAAGWKICRSVCASGMAFLILFWMQCVIHHPRSGEMVVTSLSVGHGNATVLQTPSGGVIVFDAGAMNRGPIAADRVVGYLCARGLRMIDGLVISHADADHYNGVEGLMDQIPIGRVYVPIQVVRSGDPAVHRMLAAIRRASVPISIVFDGDSFRTSGVDVRFLQSALAQTDNETSLVAIAASGGRSICIPGDLEKQGAESLLSRLPDVDALISPHHGSPGSNSPELAQTLSPEILIVSGRSTESAEYLQKCYGSDSRIYHTSTEGAITLRFRPGAAVIAETFLNRRAD